MKLNDPFVGVMNVGSNILDEGNGSFGISFNGGSRDTLSGSVVAANQSTGVYVNAATSDTLTGDFIGTDVTGELSVDQNGKSLGNNGTGVFIGSGATYNTASHTVVANNNGQGVELSDASTDHNTLMGDFIGTDLLGTFALPNQQNGVLITSSASSNTVGGTSASARDVISGNHGDGIHIVGAQTIDNLVEGDYIGIIGGSPPAGGCAATVPSALGNGSSGVAIYAGANHNTIGGNVSGSGNVISGNVQYGVFISDAGTTRNLIAGDLIGTDPAGCDPAQRRWRCDQVRREEHGWRLGGRRPRRHLGQQWGWRHHRGRRDQRQPGRRRLHRLGRQRFGWPR